MPVNSNVNTWIRFITNLFENISPMCKFLKQKAARKILSAF